MRQASNSISYSMDPPRFAHSPRRWPASAPHPTASPSDCTPALILCPSPTPTPRLTGMPTRSLSVSVQDSEDGAFKMIGLPTHSLLACDSPGGTQAMQPPRPPEAQLRPSSMNTGDIS